MHNPDSPQGQENPEQHLSPEQFKIAERVASEKLELLLGKDRLKEFSVRFMNIAEYQAMMESNELLGGREAASYSGFSHATGPRGYPFLCRPCPQSIV